MCALSWLIPKIILRRTFSKTAKQSMQTGKVHELSWCSYSATLSIPFSLFNLAKSDPSLFHHNECCS